ncbi:glycosyltransferase [Methylogaea oryzae]|uniref:glycosyltransferase n=1 Tax=Methylogaea oryzae TaxID=1295382 RepID=UPI001FEA073F|nr:glycosyltransferase [Methylogaea oryzae]
MSVSVVSHGQGALLLALLADVAGYCDPATLEVIVTFNIPEPAGFALPASLPFPVRVIENPAPKGFGANHNAALSAARGDYFCVLNPDVRLVGDPFTGLVAFARRTGAALLAPQVVNSRNEREDSARPFPTPLSIALKLCGKKTPDIRFDGDIAYPDWVAGMFMLFPRDAYAAIGGFDERYFLYYEDVDICARLRAAGRRVVLVRDIRVIHNAQRASHRNVKYLRWHLTSMLRFFLLHWRMGRKRSG